MKKKSALIMLAITVLIAFAGCSKKEESEVFQPNDYITLGEYKGIDVTVPGEEVTDEKIEARIFQMLQEQQEYVEVSRSSKNGDMMNIAVTGEIDGELNDGFTSESADVVLGDGVFIMEGFAEKLYEKEAGNELEFTLTVPESFSETDLIGKDVTFHVTVKSVKEQAIPELSDELIAKISDYSTIEEYKEYVKGVLAAEIDAKLENEKRAAVLSAVMENVVVISYPEGSVEEQVAGIEEKYNVYASLQEKTVEEYILENYGDTVQAYAEELVKEELVLEAIKKAEGIKVTNAEYKEKLPEFAKKYSMMDADAFESTYGEESIKQAMLWDKTINFLIENANITISEE